MHYLKCREMLSREGRVSHEETRHFSLERP
jgi:hypothetical protein